MSSVAQAAREAGYGITLDLLWDVTGSSVATAFEHQLSQAVEAVVLVAAHGEMPDAAVLRTPVGARSSPSTASSAPRRPTAGVDQHAGGAMATRHLLGLGHRQDRPHPGPAAWPQAEARQAGFLEALTEAGAEPGPGGDRRLVARAGYEGCRRMLDENPSTTALFVANDQMAMGALRALAEAGRRVPDDVWVVGFDDIPEASFAQPPLTTIRQDFAALGREAVRLVVGAIAGERAADHALVPPRLVTRASTARPARAAGGR